MTKQTFQKFMLAFILSMTTFASGFCNPQNQPQTDHQNYGDGRLEKYHESPYRKRMPCRDFYVTNSGSSFGKNMQNLYLGGVKSK